MVAFLFKGDLTHVAHMSSMESTQDH
jgi:hypothetical protein